MVTWVWVAIAALVVVALQALLFHRARRNWGVDGNGNGNGADLNPVESMTPTDRGRSGRVADGVRCPHCGEHNGDDYTFCQRCVHRLY